MDVNIEFKKIVKDMSNKKNQKTFSLKWKGSFTGSKKEMEQNGRMDTTGTDPK